MHAKAHPDSTNFLLALLLVEFSDTPIDYFLEKPQHFVKILQELLRLIFSCQRELNILLYESCDTSCEGLVKASWYFPGVFLVKKPLQNRCKLL